MIPWVVHGRVFNDCALLSTDKAIIQFASIFLFLCYFFRFSRTAYSALASSRFPLRFSTL